MSLISEVNDLIVSKSNRESKFKIINPDLIIVLILDDDKSNPLDFFPINNHIKRLIHFYVTPIYSLNDFEVMTPENTSIVDKFKYVLIFRNSKMVYYSLKSN